MTKHFKIQVTIFTLGVIGILAGIFFDAAAKFLHMVSDGATKASQFYLYGGIALVGGALIWLFIELYIEHKRK
jgi:hypothetical protein